LEKDHNATAITSQSMEEDKDNSADRETSQQRLSDGSALSDCSKATALSTIVKAIVFPDVVQAWQQ